MQLTSENTALVLDSASDLPNAAERHANWRVVPIYVSYGDETLRDSVDIAPKDVYRRLRAGGLPPRTAAPAPGDFAAVYEELGGYDRVLAVCVSSKLSATYESARLAAEDAGERVLCLDSQLVSAGVVLLADAIQRRLERGTTDEEVVALAERYPDEGRFVYTLETLEYLARGGRIGRVAALAGGLVNTKPVIEIRDGVNVPRKRALGWSRALKELLGALADETDDTSELHAAVVHADAPAEADALVEQIRALRPRASIDLVTEFGAALGAHTGPGAIGVAWFRDGG